MYKSRKVMLSAVLGLVAMALVAGLALTALLSPSASAAPAAQAQTTPGTSTTPGTGTSANDVYRQQFLQNFASQLGVSTDKVNSSYTAAVNATVDQAVKDGKLTQAQADQIKARAANGLNINPVGDGRGKGGSQGRGGEGALQKSAFDAAAKALGLTTAQLQTELQAGKSIADVAAEKKVDVTTVKQAMLTAAKTELDTQVKSGTLTQAQADQLYNNFNSRIDNIINQKGGQKGNRPPRNGQTQPQQPTTTPNQ